MVLYIFASYFVSDICSLEKQQESDMSKRCMTIIVFKFSAENGSLTFVKDKLENVSSQGIYKSEFRYTMELQFALLINFFTTL